MLELHFNKVAGLEAYNCIKDTRTQVLSCEYCEIFKNIYFEEYMQTAVSVLLIKKLLNKY